MNTFIKLSLFAAGSWAASCTPQSKWHEEALTDQIMSVTLDGERKLAYSTQSGVSILEVDGLPFKDLNKNGTLDPYEDWRLPSEERATDLASQLSKEEIAGLMLYSGHQSIPAPASGYFAATYNGLPFDSAGVEPFALSDVQKTFLTQDHLRHVLLTSVESPEVAAKWNNNVQALVEGIGHGIPANNSSDPRNGARADAEYNAGSGGSISLWPEELGLSATFDPSITEEFGKIASQEYRALGIATALSPQIDLATEPRWNRFYGTFGGHPQLATDMARAYVDGFQSSVNGDWGMQSVNAMVKHWPSGGPEEGGRDGHFAYGKFAVYPGGAFQTHLKPFLEGAFKLNGKTQKASAVMPYYTISFDQDTVYGENVGNGFSKFIVTDLLREKYGYEGVVCTDWRITGDEGPHPGIFMGKSWGTEAMSIEERHFKVLEAGLDQFGGNNEAAPVLAAFDMLADKYGEEAARARIERSAQRLLLNIFRTGLFENPYVNPEESSNIVGNPEFMKAGYAAQLKSLVLLKNKNQCLPLQKRVKVFVPKNQYPEQFNFFGMLMPAREGYQTDPELLSKYVDIVDSPEEADMAIAFGRSPMSPGYDHRDREQGGNGYLPISLQYEDYTADLAREQSIAAGDPVVDPTITNRSYKGKTAQSNQRYDLDMLQTLRIEMGDKPILFVVTTTNPMVFSEAEPLVDAILLNFGVQADAIMEVVTGTYEPSGLLPLQMPVSMATVETQLEDVPMDMVPYTDTQGNTYDFGFGLNFSGPISDERTQKYTK